jgi:hypothetical protein
MDTKPTLLEESDAPSAAKRQFMECFRQSEAYGGQQRYIYAPRLNLSG